MGALLDAVPSDAAAPTTALGDATKPLDDWARAISTAVEALQAASATRAVGPGVGVQTISTLANGFVILGRFHVDVATSINQAWVHVQASSGNVSVGVYAEDPATLLPDLDNRLTTSGGVAVPAVSPPMRTVAVTEVTLQPGWYWAALSTDNATASFGVVVNGQNGMGNQRQRNGGDAYPLPATLGALSGGSAIPALMFDHT